MKFRVGQKVSFLNEQRKGIVKKIISPELISVEIEEGFEIPVASNELIRDEPDETTQQIIEEPASETHYENDDPSITKIIADKNIKDQIFLVYTPENQENYLGGPIEVSLINHTQFDLIFTYARKESNFLEHKDYDVIGSFSKLLLAKKDISELKKWNHLKFQFLFFKSNSDQFKEPLVKEIHFQSIKFYRDQHYQYFNLENQKCIFIPLIEYKAQEKKEQQKGLKRKESENFLEEFPKKYLNDDHIAEVDMHIWEITDRHEHLSKHEIMQLQLRYFIKMLDSAIASKIKKIVFIHGVGNGRLKEEIRKTMDESYTYLKYFDASIAKYGVGATEVEIPHNIKR